MSGPGYFLAHADTSANPSRPSPGPAQQKAARPQWILIRHPYYPLLLDYWSNKFIYAIFSTLGLFSTFVAKSYSAEKADYYELNFSTIGQY